MNINREHAEAAKVLLGENNHEKYLENAEKIKTLNLSYLDELSKDMATLPKLSNAHRKIGKSLMHRLKAEIASYNEDLENLSGSNAEARMDAVISRKFKFFEKEKEIMDGFDDLISKAMKSEFEKEVANDKSLAKHRNALDFAIKLKHDARDSIYLEIKKLQQLNSKLIQKEEKK